jgi:filamin
MSSSTDFTMDMRKVGNNIDATKLTCAIFDPRGKEIPSKIVSSATKDVFKIMYTPFEAGRHTIELLYDNVPIPGSPFVVHVKAGCDPSRCRAYGPGLETGDTNKPSRFVVETRGAGAGGLSLAIEGPSEAKMSCIDNRDGSCDVEYTPTEPGEYDITIKFADQHIPGSPFKVNVGGQAAVVVDPSKVKLYGPGIDAGDIRDGVPTMFYVDVSNAGPGLVAVQMASSDGKQLSNVKVIDKGDGLYA